VVRLPTIAKPAPARFRTTRLRYCCTAIRSRRSGAQTAPRNSPVESRKKRSAPCTFDPHLKEWPTPRLWFLAWSLSASAGRSGRIGRMAIGSLSHRQKDGKRVTIQSKNFGLVTLKWDDIETIRTNSHYCCLTWRSDRERQYQNGGGRIQVAARGGANRRSRDIVACGMTPKESL